MLRVALSKHYVRVGPFSHYVFYYVLHRAITVWGMTKAWSTGACDSQGESAV